MSTQYNTAHQYEPLRPPSSWDAEERRLIAQLTELFDDLYKRFNRLRFEDFGKGLQKRIEDGEGSVLEMKQTAEGLSAQVENAQGSLASLQLTAQGLTAAVDNNRLAFSASGLEIKNAAGMTVFKQESDSGNLMITGNIAASGGSIGGFTIGQSALYNGGNIVLSADGYVRLGNLSITDDPTFGPVLQAVGGLILQIGGASYLTLGEGSVAAQFPLRASYGLYVNPNDVTANAPNAYIDPASGKLYRSTNTGGGGSTGTALSAGISLSKTGMTLGETVVVYGEATGGKTPYTYTFAVAQNNGAFVTIAGSGATRNYTPGATGSYRFRVIVTDADGGSDTAYSETLSVTVAQSPLSVSVSANASSISGSGWVTFSVSAYGGSGSYGYSITIYRNGSYFDNGDASSLTLYLSQAGSYYATAQVVDLNTYESKSASGGDVTVSSAVQYGVTTGTYVIIRSGPGTSYSEVTRVPNSGTYVQITGSYTSGWYPVYWNGYSGYMSASYIQLV